MHNDHNAITYFDYFTQPREEYDPILMEQLLGAASQRLTHTYLNDLNDPLFNNTIFRDALKQIRLEISFTLLPLRDTLQQHLDKVIINLPQMIQYHLQQLTIFKNLLASDTKARTKFNDRLTLGRNAPNQTTLPNLPELLLSKKDIDTLFWHALIEYENNSTFWKKAPFLFLDKLIDAEIRSCQRLQVQIEALQCQLTKPAQEALNHFIRQKEEINKITRAPEMSIEANIYRIGSTHKDKELLKKLRRELLALSSTINQWNEVTSQHAILSALPDVYRTHPSYQLTWHKQYQRTILQGIFETAPNNSAEFSQKIAVLMNILNERIQFLTQNEMQNPIASPNLPLLSLTALFIEEPNRIYLNEDATVFLNRINDLLTDNIFISPDNIFDFMPSLSTKETAAVTFEVNLLKLLHQFAGAVTQFCDEVAQPHLSLAINYETLTLRQKRQLANQHYYFSSLSSAILNHISCLKNSCKAHIIKGLVSWHQLKDIITNLNSIEEKVREKSFMLDCFKEYLAKRPRVNNPLLKSLPLNKAEHSLEQAKPFEATDHLDAFYRDTQAFRQDDEVRNHLANLETRIAQQLVTLLHQAHRLLLLSTPLDMLFDTDIHPNSDTFIDALKRYANKLTLFVQHNLLDKQHTLASRSKAYARWLNIADQLHAKHDFLGYIAITLALSNLKGLSATIRCLDETANDLFLRHIKLHKDCMPTVLTSFERDEIAAIPHPEQLMGAIERSSNISNESDDTIGYLKRKDVRLLHQARYQIMYRLYQHYHQTLLQEMQTDEVGDYQAYLNKIDCITLSRDSSTQLRTTAANVNTADITFLSSLPENTEPRRRTIQTDMMPDIDLYLASQISQLRGLSDDTYISTNIFEQNRYVRLTALASTRQGLEAHLSHAITPTCLEAFNLRLFSDLRALRILFALLEDEQHFQSIHEVDLHHNASESMNENIAALQILLPLIAPYERINLAENKLTNILFYQLIQRLHQHRDDMRIQHLSLQKNHLTMGSHGPQMFYLAQFLDGYRNLVYLDLNQNFLTERDAEYLAPALAFSGHLREIDLGMNPIGDNGIRFLSQTFTLLVNLEIVKFFCCKLTNESMNTIAELINNNTKIIHVIFDGNNKETYDLYQHQLHDVENGTAYDQTYQGMSTHSCMYLSSLLTIKQDKILERARAYQR